MPDFAKLNDEKLEREMATAKTLHENLQKIGIHHLYHEQRQQVTERLEKIGKLIKELDQERCKRAVKNVDRFLERLEEQ